MFLSNEDTLISVKHRNRYNIFLPFCGHFNCAVIWLLWQHTYMINYNFLNNSLHLQKKIIEDNRLSSRSINVYYYIVRAKYSYILQFFVGTLNCTNAIPLLHCIKASNVNYCLGKICLSLLP